MNRIALIDFEASALGPGSYPIEVAVGLPDLGELRIWLIRPHATWLRHGVWEAEAERLHGLTRTRLLQCGEPAAAVARQIQDRIGNRPVLCGNPAHDGYWLSRLLALQNQPSRPVANIHERLRERVGPDAYEHADEAARGLIRPNHRAGTDVRFLMELYKQCAAVDPDLMPPALPLRRPVYQGFGRLLLRSRDNVLARAAGLGRQDLGRVPGRTQ